MVFIAGVVVGTLVGVILGARNQRVRTMVNNWVDSIVD